MEFEWDPKKAENNLKKHNVSFNEAASVFGDLLSMTIPDPDHSHNEERFIIIGLSNFNRLLIVSHAERGNRVRLISARELTPSERKIYEQANF